MLSRHEDLPLNHDHQKMERMSHEASNICLIQNMLYGYGSIPINTIFSGMNIHLPAILMWTTGVQGFDVNYRGTIGFDTLPYKHELFWGIF